MKAFRDFLRFVATGAVVSLAFFVGWRLWVQASIRLLAGRTATVAVIAEGARVLNVAQAQK